MSKPCEYCGDRGTLDPEGFRLCDCEAGKALGDEWAHADDWMNAEATDLRLVTDDRPPA